MPPTFRQLSLGEFAESLAQFPFTRRITQVHMHHTWRPNRAQYRGRDSIVGMWKYHTEVNGWSDIAQHLTIGPDGSLWTGRNWNQPPASSAGVNGTRIAGPFMFEMIGDFDRGKDPFDGPQRAAVLEVIARVQLRFGLPAEALAFHRDLGAPKTCPGNGIDFQETLAGVREVRRRLEARPRAVADATRTRAPFGDQWLAEQGTLSRAADEAVRALQARAVERDDPVDAEPSEERTSLDELLRLTGAADAGGVRAVPNGAGTRGGGSEDARLAPAELAALRPHVVNLQQGRFSSKGAFQTRKEDVDAIFDLHLPQALEAARARNAPLDLLFWAHGGLVGENAGLRLAHRQAAWWMRNDVYPIFFTWETGFWGTVRQLLTNTRSRMPAVGTRDLWDKTTDPLVEMAARALGGEKVWGGMKWSAEQASGPDGGARYVAERLAAFVGRHGDAVRVHAVGHSAGSIFHAHFLDAAFAAGLPRLESLQFLAPAIRVDTFRRAVVPHVVGERVRHFATYTMQRDWERADNCNGIYRKSLLYLVSNAFEAEDRAPILGLEESIRGDADVRALFGLGPATEAVPNAAGEIVWSVTEAMDGLRATTSKTHGGFDDDAPTLNSVLRRVRGVGESDAIAAYVADATRAAASRDVEWPEELAFAAAIADGTPDAGTIPVAAPAILVPAATTTPSAATVPHEGPPEDEDPEVFGSAATDGTDGGADGEADSLDRQTPSRPGRRIALCIGIDEYRDAPLAGCVADAKLWAATLRKRGFDEVREIHNAEATRDRMLAELRALVTGRQPGDVVVFQFAGHGVQLPDHNGDEKQDEAFCAVDYADGGYVVDDDVRVVFRAIPPGVNVTCLIDCCHSATITRMIGQGAPPAGSNVKARFLPKRFVTAESVTRFVARREADAPVRAALAAAAPESGTRGPATMKEITFSACRAEQVAYETDGHGDFTRHAVKVLGEATLGRLTNEGFLKQVYMAFGANPRQEPTLDCAPTMRTRPLFRPHAGATAAGVPNRALADAAGAGAPAP